MAMFCFGKVKGQLDNKTFVLRLRLLSLVFSHIRAGGQQGQTPSLRVQATCCCTTCSAPMYMWLHIGTYCASECHRVCSKCRGLDWCWPCRPRWPDSISLAEGFLLQSTSSCIRLLRVMASTVHISLIVKSKTECVHKCAY
eukprot:5487080-Amphidinium_carterae.1